MNIKSKIYALDYFLYHDPLLAYVHAGYSLKKNKNNMYLSASKNHKKPLNTNAVRHYLEEFSKNEALFLLQSMRRNELNPLFNLYKYQKTMTPNEIYDKKTGTIKIILPRVNLLSYLYDILKHPYTTDQLKYSAIDLILFLSRPECSSFNNHY